MSQTKEEVSELRKLMNLLATPFMLGMMIIYTVTLLIMTKLDGFFEAFLNVERLLLCVAILRPPKINSYRIYICMIFILSLSANAVFQSHWYSLLTVPQFYSNIDTYDDLKVYTFFVNLIISNFYALYLIIIEKCIYFFHIGF